MDSPKIIHYCWFGHGELSASAKRAIASWRRYAPGFEIRRCDEDTFDVASCKWAQDAYAAQKYAFVSDYARFRMLYEHGGVYMDLGSRLVRDIGGLVDERTPFSAIERMSMTVNSGLVISARPGDPLVEAVMRRYERMNFEDSRDFMLKHTVNEILTDELEKLGFIREDGPQKVGEWTILPSSAFNPVYGFGGFHIRSDTYSTHQYSGSWCEPQFQVKKRVIRAITPFVGQRAAQVIGRVIGEVKVRGFRSGLQNSVDVVKKRIKRSPVTKPKGEGGAR